MEVPQKQKPQNPHFMRDFASPLEIVDALALPSSTLEQKVDRILELLEWHLGLKAKEAE